MDADRAVAGLAIRQTRRGALTTIVAVVGMELAIVASYSSVDLASLQGIDALVDNPAVRALYGPAFDISTEAGFAVWRAGTFVLAIAGLWAVLASTRVLRGEEEAGRWDLLLAHPIRISRTIGWHVLVLCAASALTGVAVAVTFMASGAAAGGSVLYGVAVGAFMALFMAVGALTSQLFGQRSRAVGVAGAVLALSYVLRMMADGSNGLQWLRWGTPFGWVELLQAFAGNHLLPLVPLLVAPVVVFAVALRLVGVRDLGNGVLRSGDRAAPRVRLLDHPTAFAWREGMGGVIGWCIGLGFYGLVVGMITSAFADFISGSAEVQELVARFGFTDLADPAGFVATMDAMIAVALVVYAITWVRRLFDDETSDRLDLVYAQVVTRTHWLGGVLVAAIGALVLVGALSATTIWIGATLGDAGVSVGQSMVGMANYVPLVLLFLGVTVLLFGWVPHAAVPVGGSLVAVAYLLSLFGPVLQWPDWIVDLSPFAHVSAAPVRPVEWTSWFVMLGVGLAAGAAGIAGYQRRDLV